MKGLIEQYTTKLLVVSRFSRGNHVLIADKTKE
jgi:hypothetical protein